MPPVRYRVLAAGAVTALVPALAVTAGAGHAATGKPGATGVRTISTALGTFSNFEPAGEGTVLTGDGGGTYGTTCPSAGPTKCWNHAAEPAIRSSDTGLFYASSENGLGDGTEAWRSTDGGKSYTTLQSPNQLSTAGVDPGGAPAGGDTDLALSDDVQTSGTGNNSVYVASLSLANVNVSTSVNRGATWTQDPLTSTVPIDDREWIAADDAHITLVNGVKVPTEGGQEVCISYHAEALNGDGIEVNCGQNVSGVNVPAGPAVSAFDASHAYLLVSNEIGNLAFARDDTSDGVNYPIKGNHDLYQVFSGPGSQSDATTCAAAVNATTGCYNAVWIAVSKDGGSSFTDHLVYRNPNLATYYGHQFVNVSVDRGGNIYVVYNDNHNMFYSYSRNLGADGSWHGPYQVNTAPANTAIFPWSAAGNNGKLDIVYYGTSYYSSSQPPDNYPSTAAWYVYLAQNLNVFGSPTKFTQAVVTPIVHYGGVCESGVSCTGNRDLYDDFGVAADPLNGGLASIVYSDDQYADSNSGDTACTAAATNTSSCDHTMFATQTSGPGIFK